MSEATQARIFGIDLGTTYSCISYLDDMGRPVVCQSMEGENTTPSVVRFLPDEPAPVAGRTAKDMAVLYPENTIEFIKRKIGKVETVEYGPDGDKHTISPVEVSAEILKKLAADAANYTNSIVKDVVITVPAYFGRNEKDATKEAGTLAGLNVIDIIEEPTAAAFYYGCQNQGENSVICVYDLGGGTFDVTAMKLENNVFTVLTTAGDDNLGGYNWDTELMKMVEEKFREQTGYDEEFDTDILQELQIKCENAKKQLSSTNTVSIPVNVDRAHKAAIEITREEFDARTEALLARTTELTREVFERMEEKGEKFDKIILVGGSTFMPQVKEMIVREFGMEPEINEPNESVSKGACIYCATQFMRIINTDPVPNPNPGDSEGQKIGDDEVKDVTQTENGTTVTLGDDRVVVIPTLPGGEAPVLVTSANKSFGIQVFVNNEPKIANLIFKDTILPASVTKTFGTQSANMRNVSIKLYQSEFYEEHYEVEDGNYIVEAVLEGLPEGLAQGSPVDITITMEENGLITVTGACKGVSLTGELTANYAEGTSTQ